MAEHPVALLDDSPMGTHLVDEQVGERLNEVLEIGLRCMDGRRPVGEWLGVMQSHLASIGRGLNGASDTARVRFPFRSEDELMKLEPPFQLIDGIMPMGGLAALVGQPGVAKTFLALDWAQSVRAGLP